MSEQHPAAGPPKLPLWRTISLSYREYVVGFGDVLRISWVWLAALTALVYLATWLQYSWIIAAINDLKRSVPEGPTPNPVPLMPPMSSAEFLLPMVADFMIILAALSIAVAWHRHVILGEPARSSAANVLTVLPWSYAAALILILLAVSVPVVIVAATLLWAYLPQGGGFGGPFSPVMVIIAVLDAAALAALLRLSLLLPARAIGNVNIGFKEAWHKTAGNTVRLAWGFFLTAIIPIGLAQTAASALMTPTAADLFALGSPQIAGMAERMAAFNSAGIALSLLVLPIGAGFLSHAYCYLVGQPETPAA